MLITACNKDEPEPIVKASFTISPNPAYAGDTVFFENTSIGAISYKWSFGDNSSSDLESPGHVYAVEGLYTVTLEIAHSGGSKDTGINLTILPPKDLWKKNVIDNNVQYAVSVDVVDLDGDGDDDVLVADWGEDAIIIYENDDLTWTKSSIGKQREGIAPFAYAGDMDNDGSLDIVAGYVYAWDMVIHLNKTNGWEESIVDENTKTCEFFSLVDLNGDNKLDIVAAGGGDYAGDFKWYENQYPEWTEHIIEEGNINCRTTWVVDIDQDGLLDVAATRNVENKVIWHKNEGSGMPWTKYTIDDNITGAFGMNSGDVNGDGATDILVSTGGPYESGGKVLWYENNHPEWYRNVIDDDLEGATWLQMADINNNDKTDVIATGYYANELCWYEYDQESWNKYAIDDALYHPEMFIVYDLNKDGLNDIIIASEKSVVWYEQMER